MDLKQHTANELHTAVTNFLGSEECFSLATIYRDLRNERTGKGMPTYRRHIYENALFFGRRKYDAAKIGMQIALLINTVDIHEHFEPNGTAKIRERHRFAEYYFFVSFNETTIESVTDFNAHLFGERFELDLYPPAVLEEIEKVVSEELGYTFNFA